MSLRDDLELSVLGDPRFAEAVGIAWQATYEAICDLIGIPVDAIDLGGWDSLKAENMPPCPRCGQPLRPGQWIDSNGAHLTCHWTAP